MSSVSELLGPILFTRTIPWDDLRGHSLPDGGERSYVMSKTFILMATTRELARRLEGTGVDVIAGDALAPCVVARRRRIRPAGHGGWPGSHMQRLSSSVSGGWPLAQRVAQCLGCNPVLAEVIIWHPGSHRSSVEGS